MKKAIYPGTFLPFHSGHLSVVKKAAKLFDVLYIVPSINVRKKRVNLDKIANDIEEVVKEIDNVIVVVNDCEFSVDFAKKVNAKFMVRGLRNTEDLNYEFELYDGNKMLDPEIETVFFVSDAEERSISSTILKEIEAFKNIK